MSLFGQAPPHTRHAFKQHHTQGVNFDALEDDFNKCFLMPGSPIQRLSLAYQIDAAGLTLPGSRLRERFDHIRQRLSALRYVWDFPSKTFKRYFTREQKSWVTNGKGYRPPPMQLNRTEWRKAHQVTRLGKDTPDDRRAKRTGDADLAVAVAIVCNKSHIKLTIAETTPSSYYCYGPWGASQVDGKASPPFSRGARTQTLIKPGIEVRYHPVKHFIFTDSKKKVTKIEFDSYVGQQLIGVAIMDKIMGEQAGV